MIPDRARFWFHDVPPEAVAEATRRAAARTLALAAEQLPVRVTAPVRWFRETYDGTAPMFDDRDNHLWLLNAAGIRGLRGGVVVAGEPMMWLRVTLRPSEAMVVTLHEARHLWQSEQGWPKTTPEAEDQRERDAYSAAPPGGAQ